MRTAVQNEVTTRMRERNIILMAVAFIFHFPGLKILYGINPTRRVFRANVVALIVTGIVVFLASAMGGISEICTAWLAMHAVWGLYIARWIAASTRPGSDTKG